MRSQMSLLWEGLWRSHNNTKKLLNVFSFQKETEKVAHAVKNNASTNDQNEKKNNDNDKKKQSYSRMQRFGLFIGPLLFFITYFFTSPENMGTEARAVLAITLWVATWWITEAIPIPVTSLLPILLFPLTGVMEAEATASSYGSDIIFLFLGGFLIAIAMEKWDLHKRIAMVIISLIGTSTQRILLGFMFATGFLSMWVSNTAAVMMMVPMGLAISTQVANQLKGEQKEEVSKFEKALIFGIGYAGTIGGLGTLIGTPPNIIFAAQVKELFDMEISFASWMMIGLPLVFLLLLFAWLYLGKYAFPLKMKELPGGKDIILKERATLGRTTFEEKAVAVVFVVTATMWITREFIWKHIFPLLTDGMIAIAAAIVLFSLPTSRKHTSRILNWKDAKDIPWGVLLLFGGGLAIAKGFRDTGLSEWIGNQLYVLNEFHPLIIISISTLLVLFLTEFTSNTATATMILPVLASLALSLWIHPFALMVPAAMAANCAFMMPVATPPNAIIFGTGKLKITEMIRVGFIVNIFSFILLVAVSFYLLPIVWEFVVNDVPPEFYS